MTPSIAIQAFAISRCLVNRFIRKNYHHKVWRAKKYLFDGAIGLKGVITQIGIIGATDKLTFEAFISQKLVPKRGQGAYVVMDNCSVHKGKEIEALIESAGAKLIYLPPPIS
jgi:transposase